MNKDRENREFKSWEQLQNYKKYRHNKISQEDDIDFFKCSVCNSYKDSFDESDYSNVCVDCFYADDSDEKEEGLSEKET